MSAVWGIHPLRPTVDFADGDTIALERPGVGDLRRFGEDRKAIKQTLAAAYPNESDGTISQWAGTLLRFAFTAEEGDLLVHPNPRRRTLSIGRLAGDYFWRDDLPVDEHCRRVRWVQRGVSRDRFSAEAQSAAGGRAAFFSIKRARAEFEAFQR